MASARRRRICVWWPKQEFTNREARRAKALARRVLLRAVGRGFDFAGRSRGREAERIDYFSSLRCRSNQSPIRVKS